MRHARAAARPSKGLSLFRFLRGDFSPLRLFTDSPNVDYLSTPATALSGAVVFALFLKWRLRIVPAALLGILTGLTFFKVGHAQFLPVVFFLLWYWFASERIDSHAERRLAVAASSYSLYIGATAAAYLGTGLLRGSSFGFMGPYEFLRSIIGLPTFALATWLAIEIFRHEIPRPDASCP